MEKTDAEKKGRDVGWNEEATMRGCAERERNVEKDRGMEGGGGALFMT